MKEWGGRKELLKGEEDIERRSEKRICRNQQLLAKGEISRVRVEYIGAAAGADRKCLHAIVSAILLVPHPHFHVQCSAVLRMYINIHTAAAAAAAKCIQRADEDEDDLNLLGVTSEQEEEEEEEEAQRDENLTGPSLLIITPPKEWMNE